MGSLFKKTRIDWKKDGESVPAKTPGSERIVRKSTEWYGEFTDEHGKKRQRKLSRDKTVARKMLSDFEKAAERRKVGLVDSFVEFARMPLDGHLSDYLAHLSNKGNTALHVATERSRLERVIRGCGFKRIGDFNSNRVSSWLKSQRKTIANFGVKTSNHHLRAIKGFCKWLVDNGRLQAHPLSSLARINPNIETRHPRRSLSEAELARVTVHGV